MVFRRIIPTFFLIPTIVVHDVCVNADNWVYSSAETINRIFDYLVGMALIDLLICHLIIRYHCSKL